MDRFTSESDVKKVRTDQVDDDLRSLRYLRDQVLQELERSGNGKTISQSKLLIILESVRDSAINKTTWDEAILSTASSSLTHSVISISSAIQVMLADYLISDEPGVESGTKSPKEDSPSKNMSSFVEKEEILRLELDALKHRLTEAECRSAQLLDDNRRALIENSQLRRNVETAQNMTSQISNEHESLVEKVRRLEMRLSETEKERDDIRSKFSIAESERHETEGKIDLTPPSNLSQDEVPSMKDWRIMQAQLNYLLAQVGEKNVTEEYLSIDGLVSQVQTLEVQKNDADAEITRLRAELLRGKSFSESTQVGGLGKTPIRRLNTVNIHGFTTPRRTPLAEDFVNIAPASSSKVSERSSRKKLSSITSRKDQECIQQ
jgi:hypothetical protein